MIAIVDYGVGNLFSLKSSLGAIGAEAVVSKEEAVIRSAGKIILPGVGAFEDAMNKLRSSGLADVVVDEAKNGKPLLGICLGMQMLFEKSYEYGEHNGLGLIPGEVVPITNVIPHGLKVPQIGWNSLNFNGKSSPIFKYISNGDYVYFVHSYYASCDAEYQIATTEYGAELTAAAAKNNVYGCQFHPEKSGSVGLNILRAFCESEAET